ncbi:MAG: MarR family transcriptional regulator [Candidatus Eisenbacteria bacterium]
MGKVLRQRLRQTKFENSVQEAFFNVLVASGHLRERVDRVLDRHGITSGQFNVLRILRGAHPVGLPRCEIAPRMVERAPDVTRTVDRLVQAGFVERTRSEEDGRHSIARINRKGLALLERIDPELAGTLRELAGRITDQEAEMLSKLCEKIYEEDV